MSISNSPKEVRINRKPNTVVSLRAGRLTWNLNRRPLQTTVLFKGPPFRFYASVPRAFAAEGRSSRKSTERKRLRESSFWVAVKELDLSYHNSDTILYTMYPYYGNLYYHNMNMDI